MNYTVKKLAKVSGVSVRTLHYYDEIGLLKPAYVASNGYRYYQEPQVLRLQQIMFFRELDFSLAEIQQLLSKADFDHVQALTAHRSALLAKSTRLSELVETIDKTINQLKGNKPMKNQELFKGFSPEKQAEYENYLSNRLGEKFDRHLQQSKKRTKGWSAEQYQQVTEEGHDIYSTLAQAMSDSYEVDSAKVQDIIAQHFRWICQYWTPDFDSYVGLGQMYTELEWKSWFQNFDDNHPKLALFMAAAMRVFAERNLR